MATQPGFCQAGTLNGDDKVEGMQQPVSPQGTALTKKSARWRRARRPAEGLHGVDEHGGADEETIDPEMEALEKRIEELEREISGRDVPERTPMVANPENPTKEEIERH